MTISRNAVIAVAVIVTIAGLAAFATAAVAANEVVDGASAYQLMFWFEVGWVVLVAIAGPLYALCVSAGDGKELRGLNLPRGSVRAIIALIVVGSFVNVLMFGAGALGEQFNAVIAAFATLSGSVMGFYFGNRTAARPEP